MKTVPRHDSFTATTDERYSDKVCPACGYGIRRGEATARDCNGKMKAVLPRFGGGKYGPDRSEESHTNWALSEIGKKTSTVPRTSPSANSRPARFTAGNWSIHTSGTASGSAGDAGRTERHANNKMLLLGR